MKKAAIFLVIPTLAACATVPPAEPDNGFQGAQCVEEGVGEFLGVRPSQAVGEEIQRRTGAKIFQWIGPGMMVTMDYRIDRVRVTYGEDYTITRIKCG